MIKCILPLGANGNTVANCYRILANHIADFNISPYKVKLSVYDEHLLGSDEDCGSAQESVGYDYDDPRVVAEYGFVVELAELDVERLVHRGRREGRQYFQMLVKDRGFLSFDEPGVITPDEDIDEWQPVFEARTRGEVTSDITAPAVMA